VRIRRAPHRWDVSSARAVAIQRELAARVRSERPTGKLRLVAGVDAAFSADGRHCIAGAVLWDRQTETVIESNTVVRRLRFPYVPGLLSFREGPAVLAALRRLRHVPDALICDGHGYAHPRRFGLACHVGLIVDLPTAGCGKSRLCGEHRPPGQRRGSRARLVRDTEVIGTVLRTQDGVNPVYVSVGHRIDLPTAERLVLGCSRRCRIPEPTRLADRLVAEAKRTLSFRV